jgi:hypothetical protein
MAEAFDNKALQVSLVHEARRVLAKSQRWRERAKLFPKTKGAFIRLADQMLADAHEGFRIAAEGDPYAMAVALGDLRGYNDDD